MGSEMTRPSGRGEKSNGSHVLSLFCPEERPVFAWLENTKDLKNVQNLLVASFRFGLLNLVAAVGGMSSWLPFGQRLGPVKPIPFDPWTPIFIHVH